jgi:uncharacterized protein YeeX (DUF496 family)
MKPFDEYLRERLNDEQFQAAIEAIQKQYEKKREAIAARAKICGHEINEIISNMDNQYEFQRQYEQLWDDQEQEGETE